MTIIVGSFKEILKRKAFPPFLSFFFREINLPHNRREKYRFFPFESFLKLQLRNKRFLSKLWWKKVWNSFITKQQRFITKTLKGDTGFFFFIYKGCFLLYKYIWINPSDPYLDIISWNFLKITSLMYSSFNQHHQYRSVR